MKSAGGFTILESLIAIVILILSVTAAFTAVQSALSNAIFSKQQVAAFFLAQETIEYLRNVRDTNIINGTNWLNGFAALSTDPCYFTKTCTVDTTLASPAAFTTCSGSCPNVTQDLSGTYLYGQNSLWAATPYRRTVSIQSISANEIALTVSVSWSKGPLSKTLTLRESIFNWQ
ncbi:type II secretion system protein [Patescibacteria group bacterium]|nr:MAG: type II secretion system protein [Patescibacteria group bacterium]